MTNRDFYNAVLTSTDNDELKAFYADGSMQSTAKTYGVQEAIIAQ